VDQLSLGNIRAVRGLPESARLSAIVNSCDDAIVGKTVDGVITSWNPAAERMYGYSREEIIGQPMTVLALVTGPPRSRRSWRRSAVASASSTSRPCGCARTARPSRCQ